MKRKVDWDHAIAAGQLILAGYVKDADINAKLVEQGFGPLTKRQIKHVVNSMIDGGLRNLHTRTQVQHEQ